MLEWFGHEIAETTEELVRPETTALLMWDYAEGLVSLSCDRDAFVAASARLLKAARAAGVTVIYSKQADVPWTSIGPGLIRLRMRQMGIKSSDQFTSPNQKGTASGEFVKDVAPRNGDIVFEKFLPNGFLGSALPWHLNSRGIRTIVFAGISLETGVEGTAREAINRGFYAVIAKDATSSTSADTYDLATRLAERLHDVKESRELIAAWGTEPAPTVSGSR